MASVRSQGTFCRIAEDGILELEMENYCLPSGVVVIEDMLLVLNGKGCRRRSLQLCNRHDGNLIYTHSLNSIPTDICLISKTEVAVCLINGMVEILSLKPRYYLRPVKTLRTEFNSCYSLAKLNSDKLVISGCKDDMSYANYDNMLCWGVLSITDNHLDSTHNICNGNLTHMAIKENTLYISCWTDDPITNGVYAYDIFNPHTQKFLYQQKKLKKPWSIMADRDCVYVCNRNSNRIYQLTDSGQLVNIHTVSSKLDGIFYDDQHGLLYTTRDYSKVITVYKMESLYQPEKLHETVLNRSRPNLMKYLNFGVVMMCIQQQELFDDVTICDINKQRTATKKISHLIDQIKKRDQDTYERFKECLILANRADLKQKLEEEEEKVAAEMKEKHQGTEKLHETVLNRSRPNLMKYLNFGVVMMCIQQQELFDDVTICDINKQRTATKKISHLIDQIKKRDQDTYERFKECLILANRADLKQKLEEEEEKVAAEMKEKHQGTEKLHETVLNRSRPNLMKYLNFGVVMMCIQQQELFDDVTICDINKQRTATKKISHLIDQIKKRDQDTYERFKECLILANRADLKQKLEEEEEKVAAEMKEKHQGTEELHETVLNRCLPNLVKYLNLEDVMLYIQQKGLFDDVTIRDIKQQTTTTKAISHLVDEIKQRDQDTYESFKECLILAKRADLKIMLEEEEDNLTAQMK